MRQKKMAGEEDTVSDTRLPDTYDKLVSVERLRHGEHNVRRSTPSQNLVRSIERDGFEKPLIVRRPEPDASVLHVTDGWQRYQAARELGWRELPVREYADTMEALQAAERNSIVDEWTTYQAARHVQSLYQESAPETDDESELLAEIGERTSRTVRTVERYLKAFQLPEILHPLLKNRENITDADYQPLKNHREDVRQYGGLSWQVAKHLGEYRGDVDDDMLIEVALASLDYNSADAIELVHEVLDEGTDTRSVKMAEYKLFSGVSVNEESRMLVPRFMMSLSPEKRESLMDHIQARKIHLTDAVEERVKEYADEVHEQSNGHTPNGSIDQFN
jgi:ParB-like chromosome segregation protein Spo0J